MSDILDKIEKARKKYADSLKELEDMEHRRQVEGHLLQKERDAFWDLIGPPRFKDIYLNPLEKRRLKFLQQWNFQDLGCSMVMGFILSLSAVFIMIGIGLTIPSVFLVLATLIAVTAALFYRNKADRMTKKYLKK